MSLVEEYARQRRWRDWDTALAALPPLDGARVLDLGCGIGDLAAELAARGARVVGVDGNEELLQAARERKIPGAEFHAADLRELDGLRLRADGIWASFVPAYFPDLAPRLAAWARCLEPGGWIALTEIDDLFGHEPLSVMARRVLDDYADEAADAGRYDFRMGRHLGLHLERAGFRVVRELELADGELAFTGPAPPEVLAAWRARLVRMTLLRERAGAAFVELAKELLACLAREDHETRARVCFCLARSPAPGGRRRGAGSRSPGAS